MTRTIIVTCPTLLIACGKKEDPVLPESFRVNTIQVDGAAWFGFTLPLGPSLDGPLFLSQYSFPGIKPGTYQMPIQEWFAMGSVHELP